MKDSRAAKLTMVSGLAAGVSSNSALRDHSFKYRLDLDGSLNVTAGDYYQLYDPR